MSKKWLKEVPTLTKLLVEEAKTLEEVGEVYGITKQRMSQIVKQLFPDWERTSYGKGRQVSCQFTEKTRDYWQRVNRATWQNPSDLEAAWSKCFTRKKQNAKHTGWEWDLQMGDLFWPETCPILGMTLDWFAETRQENSPSFDRVDSNRGYVKGNVQIVSWRANRIKNNGTAFEHRRIAEYLDSLDKDVNKSIDSKSFM